MTISYLFPHFLIIHPFIWVDHHGQNLRHFLFIVSQPIHYHQLLITTSQFDYQIYYLNLCYFYHFKSLIQIKNYSVYFINLPIKLLIATHQQMVASKEFNSCLYFTGIEFNFINSCSITNLNFGYLMLILTITPHINIPSFLDKQDMAEFCLQNFTKYSYVKRLELHDRKKAYVVAYPKDKYNCQDQLELIQKMYVLKEYQKKFTYQFLKHFTTLRFLFDCLVSSNFLKVFDFVLILHYAFN